MQTSEVIRALGFEMLLVQSTKGRSRPFITVHTAASYIRRCRSSLAAIVRAKHGSFNASLHQYCLVMIEKIKKVTYVYLPFDNAGCRHASKIGLKDVRLLANEMKSHIIHLKAESPGVPGTMRFHYASHPRLTLDRNVCENFNSIRARDSNNFWPGSA